MRRPFVVFSLPRSRSAWLSVFLSSPDALCGHDIGPTLDHPGEFGERLRNDLAGTCETGAAFAWPLIRRMLPDATFAVVWREPADVAASLERFGFAGLEQELWDRVALMREIAAQPGVLSLHFDDLDEQGCAELYRHSRGCAPPSGWWAQLDPLSIQVDMARQVGLLIRRRPQIEAMKSEARRLMADA